MAITYVTYQSHFGDPGASPHTLAIDIGTRTNGLLVVCHVMYADSAPVSMTYDSVGLTKIREEQDALNGTSGWDISIHYLLNPSNGNNNLVTSYGGNHLANGLIAAWFDGVLQSGAQDVDGHTEGPGGGADPSLTLSPIYDNELLVDFYFTTANDDWIVGTGETEIATIDEGSYAQGASYSVQTIKGSQDLDWTEGANTEPWSIIGSSFREAAAADEKVPQQYFMRRVLMPRSRL